MKTFLNVPFEKKEEARRLGAKWDYAHKKWYWEGLITAEIHKFLPSKKSFEDRYQEALMRFQSKKSK